MDAEFPKIFNSKIKYNKIKNVKFEEGYKSDEEHWDPSVKKNKIRRSATAPSVLFTEEEEEIKHKFVRQNTMPAININVINMFAKSAH